jgi:glycosyltransferase involved in cell wall biosynthesis
MQNLKSFIDFLRRAFRFAYHGSILILSKILPRPVKNLLKKLLRIAGGATIAQHQAELKKLLAQLQQGADYRTIVLFPPSLDWDVQLFQRPQQLALALARQGALVFYIQPKPDRKQKPFQRIADRLYLCNVHVATFEIMSAPLIYLLTWNSDYASCFREPRILYDFVDDIDVFYGDHEKIVQGHEYLIKNSTFVLATAQKLVEQARPQRPDVVYSPNGVVYEHFAGNGAAPEQAAATPAPPEDMQPILARSKPVIGYYGALARWFDYGLLKAVAALRPDYQFVLIGPDYDGTLGPQKLGGHGNIHWMGVKPYADLPGYLKCFDVATIPFVVNEITHATSPLKLFEYMAGGKPVVVTPMRESMQYEVVLVAATAEEFALQLDHALELRADQRFIDQLRAIARENTWESRAEEIIQKIEALPGG